MNQTVDHKTIEITNRDANGYLLGTKKVTVEWKCPTCGGPMGEPEWSNFYEDGVSHPIHVWKNPCGHVAKYKDLKQVDPMRVGG